MRKREVVSYLFNCVLLVAIIMLLLYGGYEEYDNERLQERITDLEEDQISLNMQLQIKELPELVEGYDGMVTKEERIEELELTDISRLIILKESYEFIDALETHKIFLEQMLDMNNIIYPEFVYIKVN